MERSTITTRDEHRVLVRRVWCGFAVAALIAFGCMGGLAGSMLACGATFMTVAYTMLVVIYVLVPLYALGYMGPVLATSLIKMTLGIEMNREGLEIAERTARTIDDVQGDLKPVVADMKYVAENARPVVDEMRRAVVRDRLLERIAEDMRAIRVRIERDTAPLPVKRRGVGDGSLVEVSDDKRET